MKAKEMELMVAVRPCKRWDLPGMPEGGLLDLIETAITKIRPGLSIISSLSRPSRTEATAAVRLSEDPTWAFWPNWLHPNKFLVCLNFYTHPYSKHREAKRNSKSDQKSHRSNSEKKQLFLLTAAAHPQFLQIFWGKCMSFLSGAGHWPWW